MSPNELKAHARRIAQEMLTQGDLAISTEIFSSGYVHHGPQGMAPGTDGIAHWVSTLRRAFPDLRAIVEDEVVEGDTVVQRLAMAGTHCGAYLGVPASGCRVNWQLALILHAGPEGTFTEQWSIWNQLDLLHQIGGASGMADLS